MPAILVHLHRTAASFVPSSSPAPPDLPEIPSSLLFMHCHDPTTPCSLMVLASAYGQIILRGVDIVEQSRTASYSCLSERAAFSASISQVESAVCLPADHCSNHNIPVSYNTSAVLPKLLFAAAVSVKSVAPHFFALFFRERYFHGVSAQSPDRSCPPGTQYAPSPVPLQYQRSANASPR